MNTRLEALLTLAATSLASAAALSLTSAMAPLLGPSVRASLAPVPDLNLALTRRLCRRRGYAVASMDRGSTILRWTENEVTYEISSQTLDAAKLAEVANKLR